MRSEYSVTTLLENMGYIFDASKGIWSRPEYSGINYSDGDDVEDNIAAVINQASDLTVLSTELKMHCIDWVSRYHLSGERANIIRPFSGLLSGDVLEIGAGCGAITRYLGELGGNVLALEGTIRRATIAKSRTRDLPNVAVLAESFESFDCNYKFDAITLIGVLEYANLFIKADDSALAMLKKVKSLLKDDGVLIIAIENQLGLKYFAGAPEDHLSIPMYGIEGLYGKDEAQTFGKKVIEKLLKKSDFEEIRFLAPLPDYKLPVSIVTENGFKNNKFDASALAWQSAHKDPQLPQNCHFTMELAWPQLFKNELALDMSNSFLIVASPSEKVLFNKNVLAYHYSTNRKREYCKETLFLNNENSIQVKYNRIEHSSDVSIDSSSLIQFCCKDNAQYEEGRLLLFDFVRIVKRDNWKINEVAEFFDRYTRALVEILSREKISVDTTNPYEFLPGFFVDAVPQNIIIRSNGSAVLIDNEWTSKENIEYGFLIFRSLLSLLSNIGPLGRTNDNEVIYRKDFVEHILLSINLTLKPEDITRYAILESRIREQVIGVNIKDYSNWWPDQHLNTKNTDSEVEALKLYLQKTEAAFYAAENLALTRLAIIENQNKEIQKITVAFNDAEKIATHRLTEIKQLIGEAGNLSNALVEAQNLLTKSREESAELTNQLVATNTALNTTQSLAQKRIEEIDALNIQLRDTEKGLSEAEIITKNQHKEIAALIEQIANTEKGLLEAQQLLDVSRKDSLACASQLAATSSALSDAQLIVNTYHQNIQQLQSKLRDTEKGLAASESLVKIHQAENLRLQDALTRMESSFRDLEEVAYARLEECTRINNQLFDTQKGLNNAEKLFENEKIINIQLQDYISSIEDTLDKNRANLCAQEEIIDNLNKAKTQKDAEILLLSETIEKKEEHIQAIEGSKVWRAAKLLGLIKGSL